MVETISPVVHGGRTKRYFIDLALHTAAAIAGASSVGALLGAFGAAIGAPWGVAGAVVVIAFGAVYAARDLLRLPVPLPDLGRQVPEWWRTFFSRPVTALLYGLGLGTAYFTSLRFGTFVVVSAAALAAGDPLVGAAMTAPFGLGRALVIAVADIDRLDGARAQRLLPPANGLASAGIALATGLAVLG